MPKKNNKQIENKEVIKKVERFGFKDFLYLIVFIFLFILHIFLMETSEIYEIIVDTIIELLDI